jgi:hypothetical protein
MQKLLIILLVCLMATTSFACNVEIKQVLIQSEDEIRYKFKRLTSQEYSVKDSYSFAWKGAEHIICTNISDGGLIVFKKITGNYIFHYKMFQHWTMMWAPCVIEDQGELLIVCSDTGGLHPFWQAQRIKYFTYDPYSNTHGDIQSLDIGHEKGVIDPEIIQIGDKYYLFYTIMDWNYTSEGNWEWWDIYYSIADTPTGPYRGEFNVSQCVKGVINIEPDQKTLISAVNSLTCTHPDFWKGKLRATLIDQTGQYYIAEMQGDN